MKLSKEANENFEWLATHFLDFANFKTHFEDFAEGKTSHPLPLHHLPHKLTCRNIFWEKRNLFAFVYLYHIPHKLTCGFVESSEDKRSN